MQHETVGYVVWLEHTCLTEQILQILPANIIRELVQLAILNRHTKKRKKTSVGKTNVVDKDLATTAS